MHPDERSIRSEICGSLMCLGYYCEPNENCVHLLVKTLDITALMISLSNIKCIIIFCGSAAQRELWLLRSRGFLITHNDAPKSVGLLWTSDHLVAETSTWQHSTHKTIIHAPGGIFFKLNTLLTFNSKTWRWRSKEKQICPLFYTFLIITFVIRGKVGVFSTLSDISVFLRSQSWYNHVLRVVERGYSTSRYLPIMWCLGVCW
jgi:hypothetical protein